MDPGILSTNNSEMKETLPAWSSMSHPTSPYINCEMSKGIGNFFFFLQQSGKYWVTLQRSLYSLNSAPHWLIDGTSIGNERLAGQRHFTPLPRRSQNSTSLQWWKRGISGSLPLREWITFSFYSVGHEGEMSPKDLRTKKGKGVLGEGHLKEKVPTVKGRASA